MSEEDQQHENVRILLQSEFSNILDRIEKIEGDIKNLIETVSILINK